ncbi:hypothetical protein PV326_009973 [Microctonus aethiopoides]|nr:hypothetical protein PV326_009973 [Microctonus aethiopoides]
MDSKILSVRGYQKHGIKDDRWTIKDKVNQYKGVLRLHSRDKKLKTIEAAKIQKLVSRELQNVNSEVKECRGILNEVRCGDKRRMRNILRDHRDLQLAHENHYPDIVYDAVFQDCNLKRRQLDKLYYVKRKKMKEFFDLKFEATTILNQLEMQNHSHEPDRHQQKIASLYQKLVANKSAAETIRATYQTILNILEKDTTYSTAIINALKRDRIEQCKVLMRTTHVGQLAAENLNDIRIRYEDFSKNVLKNMKVRENSLQVVRTRVDNLWSDIKKLVRVESDIKYMGEVGEEKKTSVEGDLEKQIKSLEDTFERVKDALQARSYDGLLSRFKEQARQRARLIGQFKTSLDKRDAFLNKKNSAELILADLKHSMLTTGQYKTDRNEILEQIDEEKQRELEFISLRKSRGELLIDIKAVLQNMLAIMVCIKPGWGANQKSGKDGKKLRDKRKRMEKKKQKRRRDDIARKSSNDENYQLEKFHPDALMMLGDVMKKATILLELSNFEMPPENEEKAQNLYHNYIAKYQTANYHNKLHSEVRLSVDHEVIDPTVFTRADIKFQSKQIVEMHTKFE